MHVEDRFNHLLKFLAKGWEIEEPVLLGAAWGGNKTGKGIYHFILRHQTEDKTSLMSLPPSPELLVFLAEQGMNISTV